MMDKLPQLTYIYNRYKSATPTREASIELRITHNRRQKYISTGIRLLPHQWRKGRVANHPEEMTLNAHLERMLSRVREILMDMQKDGCIDIFDVPRRMDNAKALTFLDFCRMRSEVRKYGKSPDTQQRYDRFINMFSKWGRIVEFSDITEENIIALDKYLIGRKLNAYSKWNNYHRFLNSFILDAIDDGHLTRNPYKWLNIERDKTPKSIGKCLTPLEFHKLRTSTMPTESLCRVRDLFVFQTYTCLSYSDLKDFRVDCIQEVKGVRVYMGKRRKTGKKFTIPLLKPALDILDKYNNVLPIISNVKYNEYLKVVAQASGIDKPLSTHWARHTGASLLLNSGVDMGIVSRICGHSSTRITEQIYAKLFDETVVDAVSSLDNLYVP